MKLENKTAVITGASTGIGRAIAVAFAKEGAKTILLARSVDKLKETKSLVEALGREAKIMVVDLSKLDSLGEATTELKNEVQYVDILVNVAGVWHGDDEAYAGKGLKEFSQEVVLETYTVGITAPTLLAQACMPLMPMGGKILNISGTFENGAKGWLPYYVSKRAIEDFTVGLSQELAERGIQVNCISPSDVASEAYKKYFPQYVADSITPELVAEQAVYLCSSEANDVTGKVFVLKKDKEPFESFHY